jgi:hypothetical protein
MLHLVDRILRVYAPTVPGGRGGRIDEHALAYGRLDLLREPPQPLRGLHAGGDLLRRAGQMAEGFCAGRGVNVAPLNVKCKSSRFPVW